MPGRDEHASEHWAGKPQRLLGGAALALSAVARALEAESDRLSLWIPVLFGSGILAGRGTGFGLIIGGAALALAAGFANAKLHTEMARAPLLAKEMRGVTVKGFVELYERRDKAKARITLRVIALGDLPPAKTPDRVRVTLSAETATVESGEALSLHTRSISRGCRSGAKAAPRRVGRGPGVPDRQIAKPALPSGQTYARDQGASDEAPYPRFDSNPEE
jgi:hypothetical protein